MILQTILITVILGGIAAMIFMVKHAEVIEPDKDNFICSDPGDEINDHIYSKINKL